MIDFSKIYCNIHPHELITNFCTKDTCQIGLCANCVCTHTQLHMQKGTAPDYENIRATYKNAQESIRHQVQLFEKDKTRIDQINEKVIEKRRKVKEIMELAKDQVSILLGNYFEEKQKNMIRELQAQEKKYGLHCEHRLDSLNSYISRQVSNLVSAAQEISSSNFLQSLPRVRNQCLVNSSKIHQEIEHQIKQNEMFSTTITCNKGLLKTLINVLEAALTVSLNNEAQLQRVKFEQEQFSRTKSQGKGQFDIFAVPATVQYGVRERERNAVSQVSIGQVGYPQPAYGHKNRLNSEIRRNSYLNDIQNYSHEARRYEGLGNGFQNIQISPIPHVTTLPLGNPQIVSNNSTNSSNGFRQANIKFGQGSVVNPLGTTYRQNQGMMERHQKNGASGYPVTNSTIPDVFQTGRPSQKGTISKKSKKIGLRVLTGTESNAANNQSLENLKPWQAEYN